MATDTVFLDNPPIGNITLKINNGNAPCYNLLMRGAGYTLEVTGTSTLNIVNDLECGVNNTIYNRAVITVGGVLELNGFLDNNFGGQLWVNGECIVTNSGSVCNIGNAVNTGQINC